MILIPVSLAAIGGTTSLCHPPTGVALPVSLAAIGGTTSLCHPPTGVALLRRRHRPTDDHLSRRCSKSRSELYEGFYIGNLWKLSVIIG
ncbi:unnamed protein product [Camellia sinensis]